MKTAKLAFLSILISASLALPVFAATGPRSAMDKLAEDQAQEALDAVSGPAFGISAEQARAAGAVSVDAEAAENTAADGSEAASAGVAPGQAPVTGEKGAYLGQFKTTGYYNSHGCASADGSWPRAQHTVSTDWSVLPPGTRIRFGDSDIVYTVEDTGVHGNMVDVYYETHSEAMSHGLQYKDVYLAE